MVIARISNLLGKFTILVVVGLCVNTTLALDGSGTQGDPWLIKTLDDFNDFAADANYWDDFTRLETDVNLAGMVYDRAVIAPDVHDLKGGFQGTKFTGVFDGNDHKILNLTINGVANDYLGLFGYISDGNVKNLGLEAGSISGDGRVGGLVGLNDGNVSNCYSTGDVNSVELVGGLVGDNSEGTISNCYSTGTVKGTNDYVGGIVGTNYGGDVSNCYSTGRVDGHLFVGGLVGHNFGDVSNCYSTGDVNGLLSVGGLVGENWDSVSRCYSTGDVNGVYIVGGLVGRLEGGSVSNCSSTGDVNGRDGVGGLVGYNRSSASNCYSTGDVNGINDVGGLVGYNSGSVSKCYSTGDVNGVYIVGGLVGGNNDLGEISNCFWNTDTQTHGVTDSIGYDEGSLVINVLGLPTSQLHQQSTFTNWDFINVWNIGENQTYPYLRTYLPSDINKDGIVNFLDLSITANQWMEGVE